MNNDQSVTDSERTQLTRITSGKIAERTKLLSTKTAAELLGVHVATLRLYGKQGLIKPVRFTARKIAWNQADLEEFMMKGADHED